MHPEPQLCRVPDLSLTSDQAHRAAVRACKAWPAPNKLATRTAATADTDRQHANLCDTPTQPNSYTRNKAHRAAVRACKAWPAPSKLATRTEVAEPKLDGIM
jgi:hypothetical protein